LLFLLIAIVFLNIFADLTLFKDSPVSIVIAALISTVVIVVTGLSPFLVSHELNERYLVLRQGWYFRAEIPVEDIKRIHAVEDGPVRTGVFFDILGTALYVTTQRHNLLLLDLREKRRFGWALGKKADRVYFDTLDKNLLLKKLGAKLATPSNPVR